MENSSLIEGDNPWCSTKVRGQDRVHVDGGGFYGECSPSCPFAESAFGNSGRTELIGGSSDGGSSDYDYDYEGQVTGTKVTGKELSFLIFHLFVKFYSLSSYF